MRFKKFYNINELFNNWSYFLPTDKEYRLFDFYALSLVSPKDLSDIDMKMAFQEAKETIIDALVEDFKFALLYALASEFRHIAGESISGWQFYDAPGLAKKNKVEEIKFFLMI